MKLPVAIHAERGQIFFRVVFEQTPVLNVMNLEVCPSTAMLATPSVALQNASMQYFVGFWIKSQSGSF